MFTGFDSTSHISKPKKSSFQKGKILSGTGLQKCPRRRPSLGKQPGKSKGSP